MGFFVHVKPLGMGVIFHKFFLISLQRKYFFFNFSAKGHQNWHFGG